MEEKPKSNRRRRERALKMRAEISESAKASEDSCEESVPRVRTKPPRPRKKSKDPLFDEDVVEGFAFLAFKSYEDLERCVRAAEKAGTRKLDPFPDRVKSETGKKKPPPKINNNQAGGSHSSSEQGYICDSESEGDRGSGGESDFFRTSSKGSVESRLGENRIAEGRIGESTASIRPSHDITDPPKPLIKTERPHHSPYSNGPVEIGHYPVNYPPPSVGGITPAPPPPVTAAVDQKPPYLPTPHSHPPHTPASHTSTPHTPSSHVPPPHAATPQIPSPHVPLPHTPTTHTPTPHTGPPHPVPLHPPLLHTPHTPHTTHTPHTPTSHHPHTSIPHPPSHPPGPHHPVLHPPGQESSAHPPPTCHAPHTVHASQTTVSTSTPTATPTTATTTTPTPHPHHPPLHHPPLPVGVPTAPPPPRPPIHIPHTSPHYLSHPIPSSTTTATATTTTTTTTTTPTTTTTSVSHNHVVGSGPRVSNGPVPGTGGGGSGPGKYSVSALVSPTPHHNHSLYNSIKPNPTASQRNHVRSPHPSPLGATPTAASIKPPTPSTPTTSAGPSIPAPPGHGGPLAALPYGVKTEPGEAPPRPSPSSKPLTGIPHSVPATASIKVEPGYTRSTPPSASKASSPHLQSVLPPSARHSPRTHDQARHSPRTHDPHISPYSSTRLCPPVSSAQSIPSLSRPWPSPVTSIPSSSSRLSLGRPPLPLPSFPLGHPPVSAPLPPTGMFAPPIPPSQQISSSPLIPPSHISSDPLGHTDLLRRELDSRFLAQQERSLGLGGGLSGLSAPPAFLRTEMHHHQHQHTHVHQHLLPHMPPPPPLPPAAPTSLFSHAAAPSLFKEVSKVGLESSLYPPGGSIGSSYPPGLSPIVHPPTSTFAPPSHLSSVPPKIGGEPSQRKTVKTGRWNAMHVRIAWEIYYHQQKQTPEKPSAKIGGPDLLRPPPGPGVGTAGAPIFSTLPRPPDLGPSMLPGPGPSHRYDSPLLGHHLTPSVPGLGGMRYPGGGPPGPSAPPPAGAAFHHVGLTPTSIPGPPPGSMFSRESIPPGLTVPQPTPHDAWRIRAPTPYGPSHWPIKPDAAMYERERREEERQRTEREERERREREERERREREERERERREKEERERREREERERERERRAEHDKDRAARALEASHERAVPRRDGSRSPLRPDHKDRPSSRPSSHPSIPTSQPPTIMPSSSIKPDTRPDSRPGSRPGSRTLDPRGIKIEGKDEVMIVGGKEAPRPMPHGVPPPSALHPAVSAGLLPPHTIAMTMTTANSVMEQRARMLGGPPYGAAGPHLAPWADPFRDPYRSAELSVAARAHDLAAREALFRDHRIREEQMLHSNPLSSLILSERYREQQHHQHQQQAAVREMFERGHLPGAAGMGGGLYHPSSGLLPPHPSLLKGGSPLGPGPPVSAHGLHHPGLGSLHGQSHPGGPPGHHQPPPLAPGLPPPLIPSMRGSSPAHPRPPDKKDDPR